MGTWRRATLQDVRRDQLRTVNTIVASQKRIETGIDLLAAETTAMTKGIHALSSVLGWHLATIACQLERQTATLEEILQIVKTSRTTQALELRDRGIERFNNGWYDESLEDFRQALRYDSVDAVAHKFAGNIHLLRNDLPPALDHFKSAARYSAPYSSDYSSYALLHVAHVHKLQGDLVAAHKATAEALKLSPSSLEVLYQHSRCCALLGEQEAAILYLELAIRGDRYCSLRPDGDEEMANIRTLLPTLYDKLRQEAKVAATKALDAAEKAIQRAASLGWLESDPLWELRDELSEAREMYQSDSFLDYQDAAAGARQVRSKTFAAAYDSIEARKSEWRDRLGPMKHLWFDKWATGLLALVSALYVGFTKGCSAAGATFQNTATFDLFSPVVAFIVWVFWLAVGFAIVAVLVLILQGAFELLRWSEIKQLDKAREELAREA